MAGSGLMGLFPLVWFIRLYKRLESEKRQKLHRSNETTRDEIVSGKNTLVIIGGKEN